MSTIQTPQANPLVLYTNDAPQLPADRTASWLLMGRAKMKMDAGLALKALEIQKLLLPYAIIGKVFGPDGKLIPFKDWPADAKEYTKKIPELTAMLTSYRKLYDDMVEFRKGYTCFLDMAKEQCMSVEKTYEPKTSTSYAKAAAFELELRLQVTATTNATNAKNDEITGFTAHCKNEYLRLSAQYRQDLAQIIHDAYMTCLKQKTPEDMVHVAVTAAKAAMFDTKPQEMGKYKRTLLPDAEAIAIFTALHKPDWQQIYKEELLPVPP